MCFLFIFHVRIHNNALQCLTLYRSLSSSSQIHGNTFSYFGVCIFVKLRQYIAIYWRHRCLNRRQCNLLAEAQNRKYGATPELIFVTNITNYICGEKIVTWRNIGKIWDILPKFTHFHVEKNWAPKNIFVEKKWQIWGLWRDSTQQFEAKTAPHQKWLPTPLAGQKLQNYKGD